MASAEILSVLTGTITPFRAPDETSAIAKCPRAGPIAIGLLGLSGDEQADRVHHGGPDKAIHHYPYDHYPSWRSEIGDHPLLSSPGGFGENISTHGLLECEVCIGDRFRLGTALVELSHGRTPCWKISHRFGLPKLTAQVLKTGRTGWYYRVLEPGTVQTDDTIELVKRSQPEWTTQRTFDLIVCGKGKHDPAALRALAGMEVLAAAWRETAVEALAQLH
ncbi:MAG: MOSC domain-containing protein [Novosphingobium sp.]